MKSWKKPTPEEVDKVIPLLLHEQQRRYFFDRLENPEWLELLSQRLFFQSPPAPIRDESQGGIRFPPWPESRYLIRMANLAPESVFRILLAISETENVQVRQDIIEAALSLPANLAKRFIPKITAWSDSRLHMLLPRRLGAFVTHLAVNDEVDAALQLAKFLLRIRPDPRTETSESEFFIAEARAYFESWDYKEVLEKNIPDLLDASPETTLALLCDVLTAAIRLSQKEGLRPPEDLSYIWRRALDQPQYVVEDVRGLLISAVVSAAERFAARVPANVRQIVQFLESREWFLFKRIALHVLRLFPHATPDLVSERLTTPEKFDSHYFRREYNRLADACFAMLSLDEQQKVFDWIQRGLDRQTFISDCEQFHGKRPTGNEVERVSKQWERDRLAPLARHLTGRWKKRYGDLVTEIGAPVDLDEIHRVRWAGLASPKSAEELQELEIDRLIDYLKSWEPSEHPLGASAPGLAQELGAIVAKEPERFSTEALKFQDVDPTYVRAILQALWEPAKQKRSLDWQRLLQLCASVVDRPTNRKPEKLRLWEADPDWSWTRKSIASLLARGLESDGIPLALRSETWHLVEQLTEDPNPTPEEEDKLETKGKMDAAARSINTTRGEAMHAVIGYALWLHRALETDNSSVPGRSPSSFDQMPEVQAALEKHLDPTLDPSAAIRSVYGRWFPWLHFLDREWTAANVPRIFPLTPGLERLRDAAWTTYLVMCEPYDDAFDILIDEYRHAVERISGGEKPNVSWHATDSRLGQHLITEYWRGKLDAPDRIGLLASFYAKAGLRLRGLLIDFIGRSLHATPEPIPAESIKRLETLWILRIDAVSNAERPSQEAEELKSFGWWFASKKFPDDWSLKQLSRVLQLAGSVELEHLVMERLAELSQTNPAQTIASLELIIQGDRTGWDILRSTNEARIIIGNAIKSMDQTVRQHAIKVVNRLGTQGNLDFRDLLPRER
jgi:hypothetical protein